MCLSAGVLHASCLGRHGNIVPTFEARRSEMVGDLTFSLWLLILLEYCTMAGRITETSAKQTIGLFSDSF